MRSWRTSATASSFTPPNGDRLYANDEAARLTGFASAEELLAAPAEAVRARFDILHADGTPMQREELPGRRALAGGDPEPMLVRFRRPAVGPTASREVAAVPVRDADGALLYVIIHLPRGDRASPSSPPRRRARSRTRRSTGRRSGPRRCSTRSTAARRSASASGTATCATSASTTRSPSINERPPEDHSAARSPRWSRSSRTCIEPIARRVLETARAGHRARDGGGHAERPDGAAPLARELLPGARPRRRGARRRRRDRGGDRAPARRAADRAAARRDADPRRLRTPSTIAVPRVLETVCEALGWDVALLLADRSGRAAG